MKKMIYILALSLGMGLSQCVSACCSDTQTKNNVKRVIYKSGEIQYRLKNRDNGVTTQVSHRGGVYTGLTYRSFLCFNFSCQPLAREGALAYFGMLEDIFKRAPK